MVRYCHARHETETLCVECVAVPVAVPVCGFRPLLTCPIHTSPLPQEIYRTLCMKDVKCKLVYVTPERVAASGRLKQVNGWHGMGIDGGVVTCT